MQLNAFYLQLTPLPHQLDSEGSKFFDSLLPSFIELLDQYPDSKLSLNLGGFGLEKLQIRKRSAWLEKIASFSGTQIEFLTAPFYDLAAGIFTETRFLQQLDYQVEFWKEFGITPSSTLGVLDQYELNENFIGILQNRGLKAVVVDSKRIKNRAALAKFAQGAVVVVPQRI